MRKLLPLPILLVSLMASATPPVVDEEPSILSASRAIVMDFEKSLGGRLKAAMTTGGPVAAIAVCHEEAVPIAQAVSEQHNVTVKRVTDRPRNPDNAANEDELRVLAEFYARMNASADQTPERLTTDSQGTTRYYRAIQIKPLCLSCHGSTVSAEVAHALATHYPEDQATGYALGELRGAFVVTW